MAVPIKSDVEAQARREAARHSGVELTFVTLQKELKGDLKMNRDALVFFTRSMRTYLQKARPAAGLDFPEIDRKGQTVGGVAEIVWGRLLG